ncbi:MAG: AAA-like domain-containing protein, partial [Cyanobacteria bacterium J06555_13]
MKTPNYDYVYRAQGSLLSNARSYVERDADSNLYEAIKKGEFCYVFNARQMGKSSLCVRVANRLQEEDGYRCAVLDLTRVGGDEYLGPAPWYRSLITNLNSSLSLLSVSEFDAWLNNHEGQTSAYALSQFIEEIILVRTQNQPIVIFVDEIDNVLSLSFTTSDLFAVIRACYNQRPYNPIYQRLTFVLLGVATPTKLIRDTDRTPFNIGKSIQLAPLELKRAGRLEEGLVGWSESSGEVLKEIFSWTGGQPYLTQKLCELVQTDAMGNGIIVASNSSNRVAEIVERHLIKDWQLRDVQSHFQPIQNRMLRQPHLVSRVLDLYGRILRVGEIEADFTDEATIELQLSGVVVRSRKTLRSYNRIYRHIFSADWVTEALSEIRPYADSFNQWVVS